MSLISEKSQKQKLKDLNINIKTFYISGDKIVETNTNSNEHSNIQNGIVCKKEYYLKNKLLHTEKLFDSRIEYTFISDNLTLESYKCPNCGMESKLKDFINGCPYCRTNYNIDYVDKDLGSKFYYDLVLLSKAYVYITGVLDFVISFISTFIFIKSTSRTFNSVDISKIFIYASILSLILYYFFYLIDGYIVLGPIKSYKERQNAEQRAFWNRTKLSKKDFFNNLNYEIKEKYFKMDNIIDYDLLDFLSFKDLKKNNNIYVKVIAFVRLIYFENGKIKSKKMKDTYYLKKVSGDIIELDNFVNIIKCNNCGASVDITKRQCEYCHTPVRYFQEWVMDNKLN